MCTGQLLSVPTADAIVPESGLDCRPRTLLECVIDGKVDIRRHLLRRKRSYDELRMEVTDLLSGNAFLQIEEDEEDAESLLQ